MQSCRPPSRQDIRIWVRTPSRHVSSGCSACLRTSMEMGLLRRRSAPVSGDAWKVHVAHTVVAAQLVRGPRTMHASMLEGIDEIGDLKGKIDILLHQDD